MTGDAIAPVWAYERNDVLICNVPHAKDYHGMTCIVRERCAMMENEQTQEVIDLGGGAYDVWFPLLGIGAFMFEHQLRRPGEQTWTH